MRTEDGGLLFAFPFSGSGTHSGHLEESENHYLGSLVKSAQCVRYHRERESFTQRQTQGERRRETSGKGGIMDEISCEKGGN